MPKQIRRTYDPKNRDQVLSALRRQILAAQLKVTLDEELGRKTSPKVVELAAMKLPALIRTKQAPSYSRLAPRMFQPAERTEEMAAGAESPGFASRQY